MWGIVKRYARVVGVPATTHHFRHSKASVLLNRGASLSEVQDILGHASPETTKRIYAHYQTQHLRDAFDRYSASAEELVAPSYPCGAGTFKLSDARQPHKRRGGEPGGRGRPGGRSTCGLPAPSAAEAGTESAGDYIPCRRALNRISPRTCSQDMSSTVMAMTKGVLDAPICWARARVLWSCALSCAVPVSFCGWSAGLPASTRVTLTPPTVM